MDFNSRKCLSIYRPNLKCITGLFLDNLRVCRFIGKLRILLLNIPEKFVWNKGALFRSKMCKILDIPVFGVCDCSRFWIYFALLIHLGTSFRGCLNHTTHLNTGPGFCLFQLKYWSQSIPTLVLVLESAFFNLSTSPGFCLFQLKYWSQSIHTLVLVLDSAFFNLSTGPRVR